MCSPVSTERPCREGGARRKLLARGGTACLLVSIALLVSACGGMPFRSSKSSERAPAESASAGADSGGAASSSAGGQGASQGAASGPGMPGSLPGAPGEAPPRAQADFDRAVGLMRSGRDAEAEREFQQLAAAYPQLAGPLINLGLLHRKAQRLDKSEEALQEAVERNRDNPVAWNELGVTQRMRGEFKLARDSYENAIRIDPDFAPAYRNLGVLLDLYMGDPEGALDAFEQYKALTNEDKPVSGWIAELRQRTGRPAPRPPAPAASGPPGEEGAEGAGEPADAGDPEQATDPASGTQPDAEPEQSEESDPGAEPAEPRRAGD